MSGVSAYLDFRDLCPMFAQAAGRDAIGVPPAIRCYIGKDDYDVDFRVYGETSGAYLQYDGANDKMYLYNSSNTSTNPGRMLLISGTVTGAMASGNQLQGMQISATFNGSASCSGGICGAEIKARHTTGNALTCTQLRGVVGNADTKTGTTTTAYALEGAIDVSAGGTITTGACLHLNMNNSGTVTNSYGAYIEGTSGVYVGRGVYVRYATYGYYCDTVTQAAYFSHDAGTIASESHGVDIVSTGTVAGGKALVGLNIAMTMSGSSGMWVSGIYAKVTQASTKNLSGYMSGAELEVINSVNNEGAMFPLVLNFNNSVTTTPNGAHAFIALRDYGSDLCASLFWLGQEMLAAYGSNDHNVIFSSTGGDVQCDATLRFTAGTALTPYWIMLTTDHA